MISSRGGKFSLLPLVSILAFMLILSAAWRWSSLHEFITIDSLADWGDRISGHPWTPFCVVGIYIIGALVVFPHTLLLIATALAFDPPASITYAFSGSITSAVLVYGIGRVLRRDLVRRLAGSRLHEISREMGQRGILTVAAVHIVPVAPFTVVSLIAGASHIRFWDFVIGTIVGMAPGILLACFFGESLVQAIHHPNKTNVGILLGVVGLALAGIRFIPKFFRKAGVELPKLEK